MKDKLNFIFISALLFVIGKAPTTWPYQISLQNEIGQQKILSLKEPVQLGYFQYAQFIDKGGSVYYRTANQIFSIQSNGRISSTFGVQSYMAKSGGKIQDSLIIFGDPAYLNLSPQTSNSTFYFQNCSNGTYRIYKTFGGDRAYLGINFGRLYGSYIFLAGTNYIWLGKPQINYLNIAPITCHDNYQFTPGWYTINIRNNNGQKLAMALKNPVSINDSEICQFINYFYYGLINYTSAVLKFYIESNGNIQSSFGVQSFLSTKNQIDNSSERYDATFVDVSLLNQNSSNYTSSLYFQNCSDKSYRIYSTLNGNRVYLGIDVGQIDEANAFFAGTTYLLNSSKQLNYLNIDPLICQDNYQFTPGWYQISFTNEIGKQMYLTLNKTIAVYDWAQAYFQARMYTQSTSPTFSQRVYISEIGEIYLEFGVQSFLTTQNYEFNFNHMEKAFFGDRSYINIDKRKYISQIYFQNCSNGTYRVQTYYKEYYGQNWEIKYNRGYLGTEAGTEYSSRAAFYGTQYIYQYQPYTYLTIAAYIPVICSNTVLSPGRYYIIVNDSSNNSYNIITNGIVTDNIQRQNKVMDKDYYEKFLSTDGSKQFWVENGRGNIHYFRTNNAVPASMFPRNQISSYTDSQSAIMGDFTFVNPAKGNNQLYVQNCSDSTYRIYSTLGRYTAYLGVNDPVLNGGAVLFMGQQVLGQNYKLNIQQLPSTNVQTCQSADAVSGNAATFYMTSDPQIGFNPFGRIDGDTNSMNTYDFLVTQIKNTNCPQTFGGIAGDMNHESKWYQARHNNLAAADKAYFFPDVIGNHDILPITSKYSMIPTKLTYNPFYWSNAVSLAYQYYINVPYPGYQSASATPDITYHTSNSATSYNAYILGLYNKNSTNTNGPPIAYYVAIHNNFDDGLTSLIQAKAWYNKQNNTVPIILVSHWVNSQSNGEKTGEANMLAFVNSLPVAAILVGHQTCNNAYMNDHCCRRNMPDDHYYANATLSNGTTVPITNSNNRTIPYINTSGIRDRIFFSISLNSTTVQIIRKAWTNRSKYGEFEVDNSKMAPLIYRFA